MIVSHNNVHTQPQRAAANKESENVSNYKGHANTRFGMSVHS